MSLKSGSFLRHVFTLRLVSENSQISFTWRFKPMHIVILALVSVCLFFYLFKRSENAHSFEAQKYAYLQESNKELSLHVDKLREERNRLAGLVEMQNIELADRLREVEHSSAEVRNIIGLPNNRPEDSKVLPDRKRSSLSSRGVLAKNYIFLNSGGFSGIKEQIEATVKDIEKLKPSAVKYVKALKLRRSVASMIPDAIPLSGVITSPFGNRIHPVYGYVRFHSGVDIAAPFGSKIKASASGVVVESGYMSGYGNTVVISHGYGFRTLYAHCSALKASVGQKVKKGEEIASVGSTGISTGPHLHYEVIKDGVQVNPEPYFEYSEKRIDNVIARYGIN